MPWDRRASRGRSGYPQAWANRLDAYSSPSGFLPDQICAPPTLSTYPWQKSVTSCPEATEKLEATLVTLCIPIRRDSSLSILSSILFSHSFLVPSLSLITMCICPQSPYIIAWAHWWPVSKMNYIAMLVLFYMPVLFLFWSCPLGGCVCHYLASWLLFICIIHLCLCLS